MPVSRKHPVTYVASIGTFPQGPYRRETPSEVYLAAGLARRLKEKMKGESIRYVAKKPTSAPRHLSTSSTEKPGQTSSPSPDWKRPQRQTMGKRTPQKTELDSRRLLHATGLRKAISEGDL